MFVDDGIEEFVFVASFLAEHEAGMLFEALKQESILAKVLGDDCGGARPFMAFASGGYQVFVPEKDFGKAKEIYKFLFGEDN